MISAIAWETWMGTNGTKKDAAPIYRGEGNSGTRLSQEPLAYLDAYKSRVVPATADAIHAFDKAHTVMLAECGIIRRETAAAILRGLRKMESTGVYQARADAGGGIHSGEQYLTKTFGKDVGGYLHIGRSSGDLGAVATRLFQRETVLSLLLGLLDTRAALLSLADNHLETVMPGTTHGQHAQPTTLAHWAAMFCEVFSRDVERLEGLLSRINRSPAGAAIMTGSDFPVDRARVAALLGFDTVLPNTLDAIQSHDLELEFACVLLSISQALGRIGDDMMLWSTYEYGMIELPDYFCGTSSIMPQKKNPDGMEDLKSLAAQSLGMLSTLVMTERGPTGLTIMERRNSDALIRNLGEAIVLRLRVLPKLFADIKIREDRMLTLSSANWSCATDLSAALVREANVDWRTAHAIVGGFVRHCLQAGIGPREATSKDLDTATEALSLAPPRLSEEIFGKAMDPVDFVRRRTLEGGPAPEQVVHQIANALQRVATDRAHFDEYRNRMAAAAENLEAAIDSLVEA